MKLGVQLKNKILHRFKRRLCEKNFVANEHHSFTFVFTFSVVVVDLPTDYILSFLFPAETDVLVPVLCLQSTDSLRCRRSKAKGLRELGCETTREGGGRRGTPARKPLFSPSRLLIKLVIVDTTATPVLYIVGQ